MATPDQQREQALREMRGKRSHLDRLERDLHYFGHLAPDDVLARQLEAWKDDYSRTFGEWMELRRRLGLT